MYRQNRHNGFTLIELLVVLAIIGVLASVVLSSLQNARAAARDTARVQAVKQLQTALEQYYIANGGYPCATANCASTGGASIVNVNGSARDSDFEAAIAPHYQAVTDSSFTSSPTVGSIRYRVRSSAGNSSNSPDSSSYSIVLRREQATTIPTGTLSAGAWCVVSMGMGHDTWNRTVSSTNFPECF